MVFWCLRLQAVQLTIYLCMVNFKSKFKKISVAPISAFRPRRWAGKILSNRAKIIITNLNPKKRPISAVADNFEVRNKKSYYSR